MGEFKSFVKLEDLPAEGMVHVRIADDVLDPEDWTVDSLTIERGVVKYQFHSFKGAYRLPNMVGWSHGELCNWSSYDGTGSHPEQYHEIEVLHPIKTEVLS